MLLHRVVGVNITSGAGLPSMHGACVWENGTKASVWIGPQATKISAAAAAATCAANPAEGNALPPWHSGQVVGLDGGDEQEGRGRRRVRAGRGDDGVRIMGTEKATNKCRREMGGERNRTSYEIARIMNSKADGVY